jgi:hypothetical protein
MDRCSRVLLRLSLSTPCGTDPVPLTDTSHPEIGVFIFALGDRASGCHRGTRIAPWS